MTNVYDVYTSSFWIIIFIFIFIYRYYDAFDADEMNSKLSQCHERLELVASEKYLKSLQGTIGADPYIVKMICGDGMHAST